MQRLFGQGRAASPLLLTACHDSDVAAGHIGLQTTADGVETCEVCHGAGRDFDVTRVHHQVLREIT